MVILLTNKEDVSADLVVRELGERGLRFWRFNVEDAAQTRWRLDPVAGTLRVCAPNGRQLITYPANGGIWFRRPGPIVLESDAAASWFANDQWQRLVLGLVSLNGFRWMNDPFNNDRAECKLVQLRKAAEIGLEVPKTIVTNSANEVSDFRKQSRKGTVVKAVYAPLIESENAFVFTHLLSGDDTPSDEEAALAPFICQEALIPKDDIRVTVVGDRAFAARLYRNEQLPVDWRQSSHELPWEPVTLPDELSRRLVALVEALGLVFAGIDLIHHLGTYYFVEANPNGEWGWLQTGTGLPIASAIVDTITAWS